ncbi:hypothetical protein A2686_05260 [Candidatus Woesebacteria bacterium RIFCSPHIGHO2_01_FULL_38_10]|uniref:Uncharacterized protein n=1 Tax=Candidatus Woesebacteria bacterium RIFCSPLOWO2_01_FULL_39_10b TaxID=1802517 RepID=A0A1F8BAX9_9BACT|nr:MAG: hypothetical protein A2686_05260 [Candidatus Woesebacteria bacterium RIFCSPHIGHO2_01_FULL_38_10]OGM60535.1 MAG: hypothetical protein A2892_00750 [Candidatus Woesebacteria bacterium RIFCSPLOWO2_01_FULL_39_10b]
MLAEEAEITLVTIADEVNPPCGPGNGPCNPMKPPCNPQCPPACIPAVLPRPCGPTRGDPRPPGPPKPPGPN